MAGLIAFFLQIALCLVILVIKVVMFLIARFDVTNSLLAGIVVELATYQVDITTGWRWAMFIGIFGVCFILQHVFKVARIVASVFSVIIIGLIGYMWRNDIAEAQRNIIMLICMLVAAALNFCSWAMIHEQTEKTGFVR